MVVRARRLAAVFAGAVLMLLSLTGTASAGGAEWRAAATGPGGAVWANDAGSGFNSLGGHALGAPALYNNRDGVIGHIVVGADHDLWITVETDTVWHRLTSGGPVYCLDTPSATVSQNGPAVLLVACEGGDHAIWTASVPAPTGLDTPTIPMSRWTRLGGSVIAGPAVAASEGSLVVFGVGASNRVWVSVDLGPFNPTPFACIGHPAALGYYNTGTALFSTWFACHGTDGALWVAQHMSGAWSPAMSRGGSLLDGVDLLERADENVLALGEGTDRAVWTTLISGGGWERLGGVVDHGVGAAERRSGCFGGC
ncbi:MAG TPA: hypothetical protein VGR61_11595 [Candidatus Dormibacteraeota bacterium]|nr:hypothetical protein [Candidatus Dormibacteraeota bacterium]